MSVSYVSMACHALDLLCLSTVCVCVCRFFLLLTSLLSSVKVSFLPFRFLYMFRSFFSFAVTSMNVTCWPLPHFATVIWSNCFLFSPPHIPQPPQSDCLCVRRTYALILAEWATFLTHILSLSHSNIAINFIFPVKLYRHLSCAFSFSSFHIHSWSDSYSFTVFLSAQDWPCHWACKLIYLERERENILVDEWEENEWINLSVYHRFTVVVNKSTIQFFRHWLIQFLTHILFAFLSPILDLLLLLQCNENKCLISNHLKSGTLLNLTNTAFYVR